MRSKLTVLLVVLLVGLSAGLRPALARTYRIGFISSSVTRQSHPFLDALRQGLANHGYMEGENIAIEYRFGTKKELPKHARDLVTQGVDLIVAGGSQGIRASQRATKTIPIVMTNSGDAVRSGFVQSLVRPGGNTTGMTQISPELAAKRLEVLRDTIPQLARVTILWQPEHANTSATFGETAAACRELGLACSSRPVKTAEELERALETISAEGADGLVVLRDPFMVRHRTRVAAFAKTTQLPAIYETSDFVEAGGLLMYGPSFADLYRRSARYVAQILQGASPAELPVERPTAFELVINLQAAKALSLDIPRSVLLRADKLIE